MFANSWCFLQAKYKEASRKEASSCLYHQLPETLETLHAKEATELQSQVHTLSHVAQMFLSGPEWVRQCYRSAVIPGEQPGVVCITAIGDLLFWPQRKENNESAECVSVPSSWSTRKTGRRSWAPTCTLCCLRPKRWSSLRRPWSFRVRWDVYRVWSHPRFISLVHTACYSDSDPPVDVVTELQQENQRLSYYS